MRKSHDFCSRWLVRMKSTTGMLLSKDQIQSWISSRMQKKKKKLKGVRMKKDLAEDQMIEEVESDYMDSVEIAMRINRNVLNMFLANG